MRSLKPTAPIPTLITVASLVFLYLPLVVVVLFSFHSTGSLSVPFEGFSTRWYEKILNSPDFRFAVENSLIVACIATAVTFIIGTAAALALPRLSSRYRTFVIALIFIPITLPGVFLGVALLVFFGRINLELSLATVAIAHVVYVLPYFLLVTRAALGRLDPALDEVAADLGASPWQSFRRVTLPQILPLLLGAAALCFALSFDEFVITFYVIGPDSTLPMFIWSSLRRTVDPSINAVSTILLVVSIALWVVTFAFVFLSERRRSGRQSSSLTPKNEESF